MNKYNRQHIFLPGLLSGVLLLSGCGGLSGTDNRVAKTLESTAPSATFNTSAPQASSTDGTARALNSTLRAQPRSAAATQQANQVEKPSIVRANQLMRSGQKAAAADMYYRSAFSYPSPQRERIILQAAEISASLDDQGRTALYLQTAARSPLTALNKVRYRYVKALLALQDKQNAQALRLLPADTAELPSGLRDKITLLRQHALNQQLNTPASATTYVDKSVPPPAATVGTTNTDRTLTPTTPRVNYQSGNPPSDLQQALNNRLVSTASNPTANTATSTEVKPKVLTPILPQTTSRIAVLLPDSGSLANVGNEIYQGIQDAQAIHGDEIRLKRYSTDKNNVISQYQQAIADGADIVVGPLHKDALATLTARPELLQTPVLSLNYLPNQGNLSHALYQFGLSPDDELRQIAELALKRGQRNGVIMVPDSAWGNRLKQAFTQIYQQGGGNILHTATYSPAKPADYLKQVQSLPSQADGANMIFLAASPTQARFLHPLLKAQAGLMPVYATSHIFSGREARQKDIDLDGIIYTEIPYILQKTAQGSLDKLKYPRLYALGMDSFQVARSLASLLQQQTLDGRTGQISMNAQRRLQRRMEFATFINGQPHSLRQ